MKVFEVLQENTVQSRLQSIGQKIRQAQISGDATAVMQAGAEMEPILKNEIMPGMYRVLDQFIRGMEEALEKDPNHPDAERVRQELPKLKAELEQSKRDSMQAGMANLGRQDVGEGRLKSKSYKKSYKAAKASGRRRMKSLRDDVNETATGMGASSIASVSGNVGTMQGRNMYNADGTMKNGVDFDNLLGGKKKTKKKTKTA